MFNQEIFVLVENMLDGCFQPAVPCPGTKSPTCPKNKHRLILPSIKELLRYISILHLSSAWSNKMHVYMDWGTSFATSSGKYAKFSISFNMHTLQMTWMILELTSISCRSTVSKVYPAMYIENVTELAFDDITAEDPDFQSIQGRSICWFLSFNSLSLNPECVRHFRFGRSWSNFQ